MIRAEDKESFKQGYREMNDLCADKFKNYFDVNWLNCANMWAHLYRADEVRMIANRMNV